MKRTIIFLGALIGITILSGCSFFGLFDSKTEFPTTELTIKTANDEIELETEIADDEAERTQGLMHRGDLDDDRGMWFVFEDEALRRFWMKNTLIPLDIMFFNKDLELVRIVEGMQPCIPSESAPGSVTQCLTYFSRVPAMYALEVNAGFVEKHGVEVGNTVELGD